jgi:beta-lactamase regulating signal transducer with metallopeptidase domain
VEEKAMHEHLTHAVYYSEVHLIYSSIVWLAALALTSIPGGSATTKHWIWLATALNFILPIGAVLDGLAAPYIVWAKPLGAVGGLGASISENIVLAASLAAVWLVGAAAMLARLCVRIAAERRCARAAVDECKPARSHKFLARGLPVRIAFGQRGPAVDGLLRSRILLPHGIERLLSKRELHSVLMHELTHARRHDNFIRLVYEIALCGLWFHPLFWVTGSRLALYRELSCDECVIQRGHGRDLVAALAKLASADEGFLLQAAAGSLLSDRLARLTDRKMSRFSVAADRLLTVCFAVVFVSGVFATVAHTACCFVPGT